MFTILIILTITLSLACIIMMLTTFLAKKTILDREKNSPYECGFNPKESARIPFSLRFFFIAIIFLIFDVEITLLLPMASTITLTNNLCWLFTSVTFLLILLLGLYYEWSQKALEWF
uniref:NADH-ubiquinone oxidoreductase chain 3 n=1 Tax=Xenograpsus ngatama TaxID=571435 RepID=A0A343J8H4_9EUCA|nr:NADH dehydrogenase subunit 3 [Xenograpsus ngatama]ASW34550.1 NADH dehydrogenase subunit 3 [Xenograpsus ngatama]